MKKARGLAAVLAAVVIAGCAKSVDIDPATVTSVELTKKNYKMVHPDAKGSHHGFSFLGIIPIVTPSETKAMSQLYANALVAGGSSQALANVYKDRSSTYFILFSIPKVTVRADVIEFLAEDRGMGRRSAAPRGGTAVETKTRPPRRTPVYPSPAGPTGGK